MRINKIVAWSLVLVFVFGINLALAKNQPNGTPFTALWNVITGLQDQIDELEERIAALEGSGCVVEPEICDGQDNDCDGLIDEDNVCPACEGEGDACDGDDADFCEMGTTVCGPGGAPQCIDDIPNFIELCDGIDNDCDGPIDEDFSYSGLGIGDACGTGACAGGIVICLSNIEATCSTSDQATDETCDGQDNDCDGEVDEDNVCNPDGTPCNDGNLCTVNDIYDNGICIGGAPMICDDTNPCTSDDCNPTFGCVFNVNPSQTCDDGNSCTEQDMCDDQGSCVGTPIPNCP